MNKILLLLNVKKYLNSPLQQEIITPPRRWQNPQNQYFSQKWKKVTQIPLFRTSHNSGLECPKSKNLKAYNQALAITFQRGKQDEVFLLRQYD